MAPCRTHGGGDDALDTIDILKRSFVSISLAAVERLSHQVRRQSMPSPFRRLLHNEQGGTAIEYALICFLIALAAVSGFNMVGGSLSNAMNSIAGNLI
jgi:Flp pilus assembly pilin Flp